MYEIDDNVKRKPVYKQDRKHGVFFKSGTSIAPAKPKIKIGKRGYGKSINHAGISPNAMPVPMFDRVMARKVRNALSQKPKPISAKSIIIPVELLEG